MKQKKKEAKGWAHRKSNFNLITNVNETDIIMSPRDFTVPTWSSSYIAAAKHLVRTTSSINPNARSWQYESILYICCVKDSLPLH